LKWEVILKICLDKDKMTELTTNQIIKIVIAVFVLVIVVAGAYLSLKYYIIPYFRDLGPSEPDVDASSPFYQECLKNKVAYLDKGYINIFDKKDSSKSKLTEYYVKSIKIYKYNTYSAGWGWIADILQRDTEVGIIESDGIIKINNDLGDADLKELNGATKVNNEICKKA